MLRVRQSELQWNYQAVEEELLSLNLQMANEACELRLTQRDLEVGLVEVSDEANLEIGCIKSALAGLDFQLAMHHYCCLYSMLFSIVPLGNAVTKPAAFHKIRQGDAAYFVSANVFMRPSDGYDPTEIWPEHASGSDGFLTTTGTVNEVMRMQLGALLRQGDVNNNGVEFYASQSYESLERGLREFHDSTILRLPRGSVALVHSDHSRLCLMLHKGLTGAKSLAYPLWVAITFEYC